MNVKERIQSLCKKNGITSKSLEEHLGFGKGYISKIDKTAPNLSKIKPIADYFGVTVDYLMTGKETVGSCEYDISNLKKHTENEKALLENFSKLNFKGEEEAIKRVRELVFVPEYTENQEELWQLIPGSCKTVEKSADWDKLFEDDDSSDTVTSTGQSTVSFSEIVDTVHSHASLAAAHNDHINEDGEMEKVKSDLAKLKKPNGK